MNEYEKKAREIMAPYIAGFGHPMMGAPSEIIHKIAAALDEAVKAERERLRECTCHPDEAPEPCQRKFALSECRKAAGIRSRGETNDEA